jgi:hypothetical protein
LMTLFTYTILVDRGSAPNPFWGICTLAICKPKIRQMAKAGDWVAAFGSKNVGGIDYSEKLVYAMRVHEVLTFPEYDKLCRKELKGKIPDVYHKDVRRRLGDCQFDFLTDPNGKMRLGVHTLKNRKRDLGGKYVLLSDHFFYFGCKAVPIPRRLEPLLNQHQGHKSRMNDPWKEQFVEWIEAKYESNILYGEPQIADAKIARRVKPPGC